MTEKYLDIDGLQTFWSDICDEIEDNAYTLPVATASTLGGVKEGEGVDVDANGVLSLGDLTQSANGESVVTHGCALYSVDAEGWAEQDGTPTPESPVEIRVARGRNLLSATYLNTSLPYSYNGVTLSDNGDGGVAISGTPIGYSGILWDQLPLPNGAVCASISGSFTNMCIQVSVLDSSNTLLASFDNIVDSKAVDLAEYPNAASMKVYLKRRVNNTACSGVVYVQLELGTTPTPYVPYGYVGLEVTHDGTTTVTPIPLPSKGFAASLPDGTADTLAVDSAGKWEWVCLTAMKRYDGSETGWFVGGNYASTGGGYWAISNSGFSSESIIATNSMSNKLIPAVTGNAFDLSGKTVYGNTAASLRIHPFTPSEQMTVSQLTEWLTNNPIEFLLKLVTPTTEHGYIDLPTLTDGCTVSIPELGEVGVAWFVSGVEPIADHISNVYKRVEAALAEIATA